MSKGSEAWREYEERINSNNSSILDLKKSMFETAEAAASLAAQKAEKKVDKYNSKNELLDAEAGNEVSAEKQNKFLDSKIKNIGKQKKSYQDAVTTDRKNRDSAKKALDKFKSTSKNKKLLTQLKKYTSSNKRIPAALLKKISGLNDNGKLLKACAAYNAYIDAYNTDKEAAELFAQVSIQNTADIAMEKFGNIQDKWDNAVYKNEQKDVSLNNAMEINRGNGEKKYNVSVYKSLLSNTQAQKNRLEKKQKELQAQMDKALKSGEIKEGSAEWIQMAQAIDEAANSIDEATKSLQDYRMEMNKLNWELFDDAMDTIKRINTESDYYIDRMEFGDLIDKEKAELTDYGNATLALHKNNYDSCLAQAEEYEKEYNKIMGQIRKGELKATDDEVIARIRELEDARRDCRISAEQEAKAIKDLLQDLYDKQLSKISDMISKYKDLMDAEKDAYEYQRTIEEKVKNIASLQKRLGAYTNNDDSEENRARIQQIKMQLEEAQQDLKDTQYDKYISDTRDMLDDLYEDLEEFLNSKLDNTNKILEEISTALGTDNGKVIETLKSIDSSLSSTLESLLSGKIDNSSNAGQTVTDASTAYPTGGAQKPSGTYVESSAFTSTGKEAAGTDYTRTGLSENTLEKALENMKKELAQKEKETKAEIEKKELKELKKLPVLKVDGYAKGSRNIQEDQIARVNEEGQELIYDKSQKGMVMPLGKGDKVFTAKQADNLMEYSKVDPDEAFRELVNRSKIKNAGNEDYIPPSFPTAEEFVNNFKMKFIDPPSFSANPPMPLYDSSSPMPKPEQKEKSRDVFISEVTLPNVTNYEEFRDGILDDKVFKNGVRKNLFKDNKFEKGICSMTVDRPFHGNSKTKYRYI